MQLQPGGIIAWILVGIIAGWLAEQIPVQSQGLLGNLIFGLIGHLSTASCSECKALPVSSEALPWQPSGPSSLSPSVRCSLAVVLVENACRRYLKVAAAICYSCLAQRLQNLIGRNGQTGDADA